MRGLYMEDGRLELRDDLPRPRPRDGFARIAVLRAGICATDLALRRGYMGFSGTPGHEFVGVAMDGRHAGRRVVGEINAGCGDCPDCSAGDPRHCPNRTVLGILRHPGAFSDEIILPEGNLHPVPDEVGLDAATFTEPLAAAFEIAEQVKLEAGRTGLVVGDGKLGILCAHVLALHGLQVTVSGRHPERRPLLPEGAVHSPGPDTMDRPAGGFDIVVEASGDAAVLPSVLSLVRPRGTVVLKTTTEEPTTADLSQVVVQELTVVGSRCGPFAPALEALAWARIPVQRLIQGRYPLERAPEAFAHAGRRGTLKVLLEINPG